MELRACSPADVSSLATMAAPLQARPDRHIAYFGVDVAGISVELADEEMSVSVMACD
jgi:hypothetical protein